MITKKIVFTEPKVAQLLQGEAAPMQPNSVMVKMEYTVVSGGTERACIMDMENTSRRFPMSLGYCGVGHVVQTGKAVQKVSVGDRVLVYHGIHTNYNVIPEMIKLHPQPN